MVQSIAVQNALGLVGKENYLEKITQTGREKHFYLGVKYAEMNLKQQIQK